MHRPKCEWVRIPRGEWGHRPHNRLHADHLDPSFRQHYQISSSKHDLHHRYVWGLHLISDYNCVRQFRLAKGQHHYNSSNIFGHHWDGAADLHFLDKNLSSKDWGRVLHPAEASSQSNLRHSSPNLADLGSHHACEMLRGGGLEGKIHENEGARRDHPISLQVHGGRRICPSDHNEPIHGRICLLNNQFFHLAEEAEVGEATKELLVPNNDHLDSFETDLLSQGLYLPDYRWNKYLDPVRSRMSIRSSIYHLDDRKRLHRPHQGLFGSHTSLIPRVLSGETELNAQRKWQIHAPEARQRCNQWILRMCRNWAPGAQLVNREKAV